MKAAGRKSVPVLGRRSRFGGFAKSNNPDASRPHVALETDEGTINKKCETILAEMDRCEKWKHRHIESCVLHGVPQVFVAKDLHRELETELDRLLIEQLSLEEQKFHSSSLPKEVSILDSVEQVTPESPDVNVCLACNANPCEWKLFCDADALSKRKKTLYRALAVAQKQQSGKTIQGKKRFVPNDLIKELSEEIKVIDSSIKLCCIDEELHRTYASKSESVTVRSIHGFDTTVKRGNAIRALEFEHNRLIAKAAASETIEGILEWMLEGWYFGEWSTDKQVNTSIPDEMPSFDYRGNVISRAQHIQISSNADALRAADAKKETGDDLITIERSLRYGIFCLTFMYFRALHCLRRERETWSGANDVVTMAKQAPLSAERVKMIQEEKNIAFRKARIEYAMEKARRGEERKRLRLEKERLEKAKILQWSNKQEQAAQRLALRVQRVFRGYIGRKVANELRLQQERTRSANVRINVCATAIARVWRGYCGRQDARYLRREMAEFLIAIREEEVRDEELEYLSARQRWFA